MEEKQILSLASKGIESLEYTDCFITEVSVNGNKIEIFMDSDESVSFEKCRKLSRHIEEAIDEKGWWGGKYTIEVSSSGVGRPLVSKRQYPKNVGRDIVIKTAAGEKVKGILSAVNDEGVILSYEVKEKDGKKNIKVEKEHPIKWEEIEESKIKARF